MLSKPDQQRYELIKDANEKLPAEKQFDFYMFESMLEIAERKGDVATTVKIVEVFDAKGKVIKKFVKKDLKKKTKTYTNFVTSTFNPCCLGKQFRLEDNTVWGDKGQVETHYDGT